MTETPQNPISVLFVCLGNICRSTMAEGVFRHMTANTTQTPPLQFHIDSCGTAGYHTGSAPDSRTLSTLADHGITDYEHGARRFRSPRDFEEFEWIFAMDRSNLSDLKRLRDAEVRKRGGKGKGEEGLGKVMLWGEFGGKGAEEVDDPYYGGQNGFTVAYKQMVRFTEGFLASLKEGGERL